MAAVMITRRLSLVATALVLGASAVGVVRAQTEPEPSAPALLTGTLAKARATGEVTIGYRESSVPFSYLSSRGEPIGYSIELCKAIVEAIADAVHRTLAVRWVAVNPATRIEAVTGGRIDLECGSTTSNLERQKVVSFSPILFVAGTKLLVKKGSPVKSFRDLAGQTVAVTGGTTNEQTMRELSARFKLNLNLLASPDHAESFAQVKSGKAVAFATDDVLLYGFIAQDKSANRGRSDYDVVGEFLSYDPYGVMFRKGDPQLAAVIHDTFVALAEEGEIERLYKRWFLRRLPSGTSIDLPMSPQLEHIIQTLSGKTE
jgi:glutamate/aspartate transport system substrate-binding protein